MVESAYANVDCTFANVIAVCSGDLDFWPPVKLILEVELWLCNAKYMGRNPQALNLMQKLVPSESQLRKETSPPNTRRDPTQASRKDREDHTH